MSKMGTYCKAYYLETFESFPGWKESAKNIERESKPATEGEAETEGETATRPFAYLQENYTVTAGIFLDEDIVFDAVNDEWISFCKDTLKFEVPNYANASNNGSVKEQGQAAQA